MSDNDMQSLRDWLIDRMKDDAPVEEMISSDEESGMIAVRTTNGSLFGIHITPISLSISKIEPAKKETKKKAPRKKNP